MLSKGGTNVGVRSVGLWGFRAASVAQVADREVVLYINQVKVANIETNVETLSIVRRAIIELTSFE